MAFYPQLSTGCLAQYPISKRRRLRTILNESEGGSRIAFGVPEAGEIEWDLQYEGLTSGEANALTSLFRDCEGQLQTFVFADPFANLLARSEEFHSTPWQSDALLTWTGGIADPMGSSRARRVVNTGAAAQGLRQSVNLPGDYQVCFSFWARSGVPTSIAVSRTAGAVSAERTVVAKSAWTRFEIASALSTGSSPSTVSIMLPAGGVVELFGAQLEAQTDASGYMKTGARSGVFTEARFAQDSLPVTGETVDSWSARVRIRAREI